MHACVQVPAAHLMHPMCCCHSPDSHILALVVLDGCLVLVGIIVGWDVDELQVVWAIGVLRVHQLQAASISNSKKHQRIV